MRNPFDYANPVRSGDLFAGRTPELSRIGYVLDQAGSERPAGYIALHGRRAAGKTSLLNMTQRMAEKRGHVTARLDLVPADADPVTFFSKAYEVLIHAVGSVVELTAPDGRRITPRLVRRIVHGAVQDELPLEFPESLAQAADGGRLSELALRADLEYLAEQVGRPIVLLMDEAQLVADQMDVLSTLRTLGMQLRGYVFVFAGTADLLVRINEVFDPLLRQLEPVKVEQFFEFADVLSCVSRPLVALGLDPHDCFEDFHGIVHDLMSLTDGNPYEIQLFCHVMFHRWQSGETQKMVLSPGTLDSLREVMEAGGQVQDRPLISAVRKMTRDELVALNLLCSSLETSTVDEIWFAHCIAGEPSMTRAEFDDFRARFVAKQIVEIDNGKVRVSGDQFDHIYVRLWTLNKVGSLQHPQLVSRSAFRALLTRRLVCAIDDAIADLPAEQLSTCCYWMSQKYVDAGLAALGALEENAQLPANIEFLYEAIVGCGFPAALDITTVKCSFAGTTAVRWVYSTAAADIELAALPIFRAACERVRALGGELHSERLRLELRQRAEVQDWLVANAGEKARRKMANRHIHESFPCYNAGDVAGAVEHLTTAFRFKPSWTVANNLSYLALIRDVPDDALAWAEKALQEDSGPKLRALSRYNGATALVQLGELERARSWLEAAAAELAPLEVPDHACGFLLVPKLLDGEIRYEERTSVNLPQAIDAAVQIVQLAERFAGLQDSAD
ncbi:ATP-binding protein [Saccharopolyspora sp. WRP15-2]|uniref:ATP-binding protein n=1 Tax=Saccharopolyspora oryzae TaxID=2997343 RepID=A0ABT4V4S4_9PSEU|nr:ATP-binding protein [Saccharopolyspora oryzae]